MITKHVGKQLNWPTYNVTSWEEKIKFEPRIFYHWNNSHTRRRGMVAVLLQRQVMVRRGVRWIRRISNERRWAGCGVGPSGCSCGHWASWSSGDHSTAAVPILTTLSRPFLSPLKLLMLHCTWVPRKTSCPTPYLPRSLYVPNNNSNIFRI